MFFVQLYNYDKYERTQRMRKKEGEIERKNTDDTRMHGMTFATEFCARVSTANKPTHHTDLPMKA